MPTTGSEPIPQTTGGEDMHGHRLVGWLVGGLVGWWVGGLVGWWVGGLVGWWVG